MLMVDQSLSQIMSLEFWIVALIAVQNLTLLPEFHQTI